MIYKHEKAHDLWQSLLIQIQKGFLPLDQNWVNILELGKH